MGNEGLSQFRSALPMSSSSSKEDRIIEILLKQAELFRILEEGVCRIEAKLENIQTDDLRRINAALSQLETRLISSQNNVCCESDCEKSLFPADFVFNKSQKGNFVDLPSGEYSKETETENRFLLLTLFNLKYFPSPLKMQNAIAIRVCS